MRDFNTKGLDRVALDQVYGIVLVQKLALEAKMERLTKELSVGACAIKDGTATLEQVENGLLNLVAYSVAKIDLSDELDDDLKAIELVNDHLKKMKEYEVNRIEMFKKENKKVKKSYMVYTDSDFTFDNGNIFCSVKKYLSDKQFISENSSSWKVIGKLVDKSSFEIESYLL